MSAELKKEITEVLMRPKISGRIPISRDLDAMIQLLCANAKMVKVKKIRSVKFSDKKDHYPKISASYTAYLSAAG